MIQEQQQQDNHEEYQQVSFRRIEELEQHGIAKSDIQKLKAGGFHTIESVSITFSPIQRLIQVFDSRLPILP